MDSIEEIRYLINEMFKVNIDIFISALRLSPNAQGYVAGSISELLLKEMFEVNFGMEVSRIKEKWEGEKHPMHHGDFYFRVPGGSDWYVLESKGVKSNSEKWHRLYNYENLLKFMVKHSDKVDWINQSNNVERQVTDWIEKNLPRFLTDYSTTLYDYEEIQNYLSALPSRDTEKKRAILALKGKSREELNQLIDDRLEYLLARLGVLETHFVSGTSGSSQRTQATPRKDEFAIVAIDIVIRYLEHKFLYALPGELPASSSDENHLQQNYVMGFVFYNEDDCHTLSLADLWYQDFMVAFNRIDKAYRINPDDMQIDERFQG